VAKAVSQASRRWEARSIVSVNSRSSSAVVTPESSSRLLCQFVSLNLLGSRMNAPIDSLVLISLAVEVSTSCGVKVAVAGGFETWIEMSSRQKPKSKATFAVTPGFTSRPSATW
jgi:hypothetical protein